jgi:hypothetical protein
VTNEARDRLASATITALRGEDAVASDTTRADGRYELALAPGEYRLLATRAGHTTRRRSVVVGGGDTTCDFGPSEEDATNPYWLSDVPEVERVDVKEDAPGGPLTVALRLSEPLPEAARSRFGEVFELVSGTSTTFLRTGASSRKRLKTETKWDDAGQVFTLRYAGPYLASGATDVAYSVLLTQDVLETRDPVTRDFERENLGIADAAANRLGRGDVRYAFLKRELFPPSPEQLTDRVFGYLVQDRRWNLTHEGLYRFVARRDEAGPALVAARIELDEELIGQAYDELRLTLSEPMSVAKDRDNLAYTSLDKARRLVVLNASLDATGEAWQPLAATLRDLEIDEVDPTLVTLRFPQGTFEDLKRVEVTLGPDFRDPVGNLPDEARSRAVVSLK